MSPEGFDGDEMAENYRIYTLKKILFIVICIIAVVAVIVALNVEVLLFFT